MKTDVQRIAESIESTSPIVSATLMLLHAHETKDSALIERAQSAFDIVAAEGKAKIAWFAEQSTNQTSDDHISSLQAIITGLDDDLEDISAKPTNNELRSRLVSVTTAARDLAKIVANASR